MQVEYIIVGQGICGSFLSYYLTKKSISHIVIDESNPYTASKVASGVINPITGRRLVRTWMIEDIMPFTVNAYKGFEIDFDCSIISQTNIIDFHTTEQMKAAFNERLSTEIENLKEAKNEQDFKQYFNFNFGAGEIQPCWLIDINIFLTKYREDLISRQNLLEEKFEISNLKLATDKVVYKDISASKIIFCDGINGTKNPYFKALPYAPNKGEVLIAEINGLPRKNIYKTNLSIVPWKNDLFWIGSTYEWKFESSNPTETFKAKTTAQLNQWLKLPYKALEHWASIRPANIERRPFVGLHPIHSQIGILNGMGTKGCSLAPYFANELVEFLLNKKDINPYANVKRFSKIIHKVDYQPY